MISSLMLSAGKEKKFNHFLDFFSGERVGLDSSHAEVLELYVETLLLITLSLGVMHPISHLGIGQKAKLCCCKWVLLPLSTSYCLSGDTRAQQQLLSALQLWVSSEPWCLEEEETSFCFKRLVSGKRGFHARASRASPRQVISSFLEALEGL